MPCKKVSDIEAAYRRHYGDLKQLILASKRAFMEKVKLGVDISVQLNRKNNELNRLLATIIC